MDLCDWNSFDVVLIMLLKLDLTINMLGTWIIYYGTRLDSKNFVGLYYMLSL